MKTEKKSKTTISFSYVSSITPGDHVIDVYLIFSL